MNLVRSGPFREIVGPIFRDAWFRSVPRNSIHLFIGFVGYCMFSVRWRILTVNSDRIDLSAVLSLLCS